MGFEVSIVKFVQKLSCSFLNSVNSVLTVIGETSMLFMVFIALYLCYNKDFAVKYLFIFMISGIINGVIKAIVGRPRPYNYDGVLDIKHTGGTSFPSGHSQNYSVQATTLGIEYFKNDKTRKNRILVVVGLTLLGLIVAFTRIYLGQHFLSDVTVGLALGVAIAIIINSLLSLIPSKIRAIFNIQTILLMLIPLLLILVMLIEYFNLLNASLLNTFYSYLAIYLAILIGYIVDKNYIKYNEKSVWYLQILKILIAGLGILALSYAFKWVKDNTVMHFYYYFTSTLYVTLFLPLLFKFVFKNKYDKSK